MFADRGLGAVRTFRVADLEGTATMKKMTLFAAAIALAIPAVSAPVLAQDEAASTPELAELDWYRVMFMKWKPGKARRAHEIIAMFRKVDDALGLESGPDFHMASGKWDSIVALPMRQGIASMGWAGNPEGEKWDAEFARQAGGKEQAEAIWEEFDSLIADSERHIGHIDRD